MSARAKIIACQVFVEELRSLLPGDVEIETLTMSLHERPRSLHQMLQERIDASEGCDTVILGYGMCGQAAVGLRATHCRLVLPRADDCISMFLGSRSAYRAQHEQEAGTYFLTKGWVGSGVTTPFSAYDAVRERWGAERADRMMRTMLGHYRRLAFVRTGSGDDALADARGQARDTAHRFGLRYEEIEGSRDLVYPLLYGPWDERFIVVPVGGTVHLTDFLGDGAPEGRQLPLSPEGAGLEKSRLRSRLISAVIPDERSALGMTGTQQALTRPFFSGMTASGGSAGNDCGRSGTGRLGHLRPSVSCQREMSDGNAPSASVAGRAILRTGVRAASLA